MSININTNLANKEFFGKAEDDKNRLVKTFFLVGLLIFPWLMLPEYSGPSEFFREILIFSWTGVAWILVFLQFLKRGEWEWRRTKLNWILGAWVIVLGLIFLYSQNYKVGWEGYPGSLTGGLSEYLAFIAAYFLSVQLYSAAEWRKVIQYFLISITGVLALSLAATVYLKDNSFLTLNFARTPSLIAAAAGLSALALWWMLRKTESSSKGSNLILVLILLFISSLLDFYIGWLIWITGLLLLLLFDLGARMKNYRREKDESRLGLNRESKGFVSLLLREDTKYLFLILLFALSRFLSQSFLKQQKLEFMPFFSYLVKYPLLGQKVFFYLLLNLIVSCFGIYYFWKLKKERPSILLILSCLVGLSIGHLLYYSESAIYFLLNWILIIYSGLTFLRKPPEKDYLYFLKPGSQGKRAFVFIGAVFLVIILGLIILRVKKLFG